MLKSTGKFPYADPPYEGNEQIVGAVVYRGNTRKEMLEMKERIRLSTLKLTMSVT